MTPLEAFRHEVDDFMRRHPQSPLEPGQQAAFEGLDYYPAADDLIFEVEVERLPADAPTVSMQTSTGDSQSYRPYGRFEFEVDGQAARLTLYSDPYGQSFFLPFRDATSGGETYGAGRYLDDHRPALLPLGRGRFRVDFNFAYNPYCANQSLYSCPLPPRENWLSVPIRAGEKDFK
ncbi:MAG: DUF1684 domain-containing protein [Candidatus Promineifilaceae bacterium]